MDLNAPLLHEFTYQAMAHDVVPIKEGDKVTYTTVIHQGTPQEEEKEMEITENDKIWLEFRHMHMKDALTRLDSDFKKFKEDNRNFDTSDANAQQNKSLSAVKDMAVGLTQFTETRDAYSLHINMAQDCMNIFGQHKLSDVALVEQPLATGLDEDYRKPKQMADQLVRLLDDESIRSVDRLRLILLFLMYRDGVINEDIQRLLAHASLPPQDGEIIGNFELLGSQMTKQSLKETRPPAQPLFPRKSVPPQGVEVDAFSRFEPNLKLMLDELARGTLDQSTFPYTKAPEDGSEEMALQTQASLRSAKPTWARNRMSTIESRQRVIVFMAGGATYSEARSCYESSRASGRDVFLATSHMLSPGLFIKQVQDLSQDRRRLDLPIDRPKPKAPAHLFMRNDPPPPPKPPPAPQPQARPSAPPIGGPPRPGMPSPAPPTQQMANVNLNSATPSRVAHGNGDASAGKSSHKLEKKKEPEKEKKKRGFFGSKK
jgi:syntaxin-binding protein 1